MKVIILIRSNLIKSVISGKNIHHMMNIIIVKYYEIYGINIDSFICNLLSSIIFSRCYINYIGYRGSELKQKCNTSNIRRNQQGSCSISKNVTVHLPLLLSSLSHWMVKSASSFIILYNIILTI